MKNDIEWLKEQILILQEKYTTKRDISGPGNRRYYNGMLSSISLILDFINELDKPEVLSQQWVEKHTWNNHYIGKPFVYVNDLQNLHVPKQKLPVIPKYVADWIESPYRDLDDMYIYERPENVYEWTFGESDSLENSRLKDLIDSITNGYEVEDEQKYYVMNEENELILGWNQSAYMTPCIEGYEYMNHNGRENLFQLTEKEIKDYDSRYWAFAVKVEEVE